MLAVPRKSLLSCLTLSMCIVFLAPVRCAAWGNTAHRIIARVALSQLRPQARAQAAALLGKEDFVAASTYADEISLFRREASGWHFVDIPASASTYVAKRDCIYDNCMVAMVERFERVLGGSTKDSEQQEALKFLIHLVGDLSQPFHCYDDNDKGGNLIRVKFGGKLTNLHAVWDTYMLERMLTDPTKYVSSKAAPVALGEDAYAAQLIDMLKNSELLIARYRNLKGQDIEGWGKGMPEDWAVDSHEIALKAVKLNVVAPSSARQSQPQTKLTRPQPSKSRVGKKIKSKRIAAEWSGEMAFYFAQSAAQKPAAVIPTALQFPGGYYVANSIIMGETVPELSGGYYAVNSIIVEQQLLKAGLRLARLLNDVLDGSTPR